MLKQRVITALILLAVLLPALFADAPEPFLALTLIFIAAAAWEWARLNGLTGAAALGTGLLCSLLCVGLWALGWIEQPLPRVWLIGGAAWVLLSAWALRAGVAAWSLHGKGLRWLAGLAALCLTWLAVAQAKLIGVNFLISVLTLVWMADIAAYFAGHAWGSRLIARKLAASISPGKSWEGVIGGAVGVLLLALAWVYADSALGATVPSLYTHLAASGWPMLLLACLFLSGMSVVGDLMESLVKRSAGVKDSSGLLPGHGGVLDRVDALLPALPLAMMLQAWVGA